MTNATATSKHKCETCNATFRRAEHLKRHARSHSSEKPFVCGICSKKFARSDILHRHELSHETTGDRGLFRLATRTFRACQQCAGARQRCTGDHPCGRCSKRSLTCTFPEDKKAHVLSSMTDATPQAMPMTFQGSFNLGQEDMNQYHLPEIPPSGQMTGTQPQIANVPAGTGLTSGLPPSSHIPNETSITRSASMSGHVDTSTNSWYNPGSFNPNVHVSNPAHQTYLDRPFLDDFVPDLPNLDDWWNPNHWIPLSLYPSPSDLEQEFRYEAHSTHGSAPDQSIPAFRSPNHHHPLGSFHDLGEASRRHSDSVFGSATYEQSPMAVGLENMSQPRSSVSNADGQSPNHRRKRRRIEPTPAESINENEVGDNFAFPIEPDELLGTSAVANQEIQFMTEETLQTAQKHFSILCRDQNFTSTPFETGDFPSLTTFNRCIGLYFENFHKHFPLIHKATLLEGAPWLLFLAIATIGASFDNSAATVGLREAFQEFLRRSITLHALVEERKDPEVFIPIAQARLLNVISLSQSRLEQHRNLVPRYHAELARSCLELGLLQAVGFKGTFDPSDQSQDVASRWHVWISEECRRRTGYLIWFLDSALAYLSNSGPLCSMDDARAPMPSAEELWNANSATTWSQQCISQPPTEQPSLCQSMETLYLKKQVSPTTSELGHILLVHALYQKTWETGKHLKQPLSNWQPTAKAKGFIATPSKDTFWLPSYPLYANWRNSACDCLDVLHWYASSVVARAAGIEHNAVLHLHLARIVLLTPFQEIQDLCLSLIGRYGSTTASFYVHDGSYQSQSLAKLPQIRKITWRWLREDQHKARLAMIHAGSVFWHVRRYSCNSFFEPTAVYLASIVLWTYGSYKSAALAQGNNGAAPSDATAAAVDDDDNHAGTDIAKNDSGDVSGAPHTSPSSSASSTSPSPSPSPSYPQFIHLDRPCDDEMVQHFVRHGAAMAGHISGVGDITVAPHRILLEGAKLLKGRLWDWGVSREYYGMLQEMGALRKEGGG